MIPLLPSTEASECHTERREASGTPHAITILETNCWAPLRPVLQCPCACSLKPKRPWSSPAQRWQGRTWDRATAHQDTGCRSGTHQPPSGPSLPPPRPSLLRSTPWPWARAAAALCPSTVGSLGGPYREEGVGCREGAHGCPQGASLTWQKAGQTHGQLSPHPSPPRNHPWASLPTVTPRETAL